MTKKHDPVRVTLSDDDFYPRTFCWAGRSIRVLFVEGFRVSGGERRFRVRTIEGVYELIQHPTLRSWSVSRRPWWWERALQAVDSPRFAPAGGRGRVGRAQARFHARQRAAERSQVTSGGRHASGFAVVR